MDRSHSGMLDKWRYQMLMVWGNYEKLGSSLFRTICLGPLYHFYFWFPSLFRFSDSSRFIEYWVPVEISNVQRELYCEKLLLNPSLLQSSSTKDLVGALHDLLRSTRKVGCFCFNLVMVAWGLHIFSLSIVFLFSHGFHSLLFALITTLYYWFLRISLLENLYWPGYGHWDLLSCPLYVDLDLDNFNIVKRCYQ